MVEETNSQAFFRQKPLLAQTLTFMEPPGAVAYIFTYSSSSRCSIKPRSIFPTNSPVSTPMVSRMRRLSMVLTWSQRARESLGRRVSFADSSGCTKRSAALPATDESGTTVSVEEMSFASVLETTTHGLVLGTSAPRAGSRLTHTNEPLTTRASLLYPRGQTLDLFDSPLAVPRDIPRPIALSTLFGCVELSNLPDKR